MKLLGSLLIIVASVVSSFFYEKKLKLSIKNTDELCKLIVHIKNKIEYFSLAINEIYASYPTENDFISGIFNDIYDFSSLDKDLEDDTKMFFSSIGKGYKKEQLALCDYLINRLTISKEKMKTDFNKKVKIFRSLSLFTGIGMVILLI